jgi:serine/threonine protein phosphatase 1
LRTVVIGDVHGMVGMLELLISYTVRSGDRIVFLGDLVDKGPDSPGTVSYARKLADRHEVVLVLGNHEDKHALFRERIAAGKPHTNFSNWQEMKAIYDKLRPEDIDFLDSAVPYYRIDEKYVAVHAGISSEVVSLDDPSAKKYLCRTRYVRKEDGTYLHAQSVGDEPSVFWAEKYDGRFGHVIYGHHPRPDRLMQFHKHATGIDTGAVYGGRLTAAILDPMSPVGPYFSSVKLGS